jgi:hypothetical protein
MNEQEYNQEAIHATNKGTFGTPSREWLEWLDSLHSASDSLSVKTNVTEEEN